MMMEGLLLVGLSFICTPVVVSDVPIDLEGITRKTGSYKSFDEFRYYVSVAIFILCMSRGL